MEQRKSLLSKINMPIGKDIKKKFDNWLNENVNIPMAKKGYEDVGAAISAAASSAGDLLIPDDLADVAMSVIPGAKIMKSAKKGMKVLKASKPLDYKAMDKAEQMAADLARQIADKKAPTLKYGEKGAVEFKKPDLFDAELRQLEKQEKALKK